MYCCRIKKASVSVTLSVEKEQKITAMLQTPIKGLKLGLLPDSAQSNASIENGVMLSPTN